MISAPRVLIDVANLRNGGGVQVAASFLDEVARLKRQDGALRYPWLRNLDVEATPEVLANILPETRNELYITEQVRSPANLQAWRAKHTHDVSFAVFGPIYGSPRAARNIVGFADVTSIYSVPALNRTSTKLERVRALVRRRASRAMFSRADTLVVEAPHVRQRLKDLWQVNPEKVHVVPNCVNEIFIDAAITSPPPERSGWLYVTRAYPHKNIDFLGKIGTQLKNLGVTDIRFLLTLRPDEWESLSAETRSCAENLGPKTVAELPEIYSRAEGVVFPSLLECFSATPLEAIFCDLPLVASQRNFVRDVAHDAALYAEPDDASAWATAIIRTREDADVRNSLHKAREKVIASASTAAARAESYLQLIDQELDRVKP